MSDTTTESVVRVIGPINAAGLEMTLETGRLRSLADGAVVVKVGDTTVLVHGRARRKPREGIDFFPLTVDVEERMYAAGKIPGSFFRREGRPGEHAILTCRLTDRPLRPSFPDDFRNEVQVIATILGADLDEPARHRRRSTARRRRSRSRASRSTARSARCASRTTTASGSRTPRYQEGDESTFEIVVAGRRLDDGDIAIMMVEAGGTERPWELYEAGAPKVTEEVIAEGLEASKQWIGASIDLQLAAARRVTRSARPDRSRSSTRRRSTTRPRSSRRCERARRDRRRPRRWRSPTRHERNARLDEIEAGLLAAPRRHRRRAGPLRRRSRAR